MKNTENSDKFIPCRTGMGPGSYECPGCIYSKNCEAYAQLLQNLSKT